MLRGIEYQGGTAWTKFVDAVRRLLGLDNSMRTALDELIQVTDQILDGDLQKEEVKSEESQFSPDDIDKKAATRAYSGTSTSPASAAKLEQQSYVNFMTDLREDMLKDLPEGNEQLLEDELAKIKDEYIERRNRVFTVTAAIPFLLMSPGAVSSTRSRQADEAALLILLKSVSLNGRTPRAPAWLKPLGLPMFAVSRKSKRRKRRRGRKSSSLKTLLLRSPP